MSQMRRRELLKSSASALLAATMAPAGRLAHAETPGHRSVELDKLAIMHTDEGVLLSYSARFDLPRDLELALSKGIAVVFVAEANVFRKRWYWTDQPKGETTRRWRLAYQPLTRRWKLNLDGLSRHYATLNEALDALRRTDRWRIADPIAGADDQDCYVDFSFRLDTDELPRPLQIGLGGLLDWNLDVQRRAWVPALR
ncbi:MAG: DUF4390 domain-containing protein [Aquabacterium sp.]|uniref:DUF4390 domain-containing protein n=1 Tax=Aquabacterium sp. TaxID=1872578 RepID=UPI0025C4E032|nr:DUF4390 domain-containing protein [Aquabacterium sp.]MBI5924983.1 DUF4390 domain-containing protein [Aquabacterium sp.]